MHLLNLAGIATYLVMWLATRGQPLPGPVLHVMDGAGVVLACVLEIAMSFAASDRVRGPTFSASSCCSAFSCIGRPSFRAIRGGRRGSACCRRPPLPVITYVSYARAGIASLPHPAAYPSYARFSGSLAVLLSTKISSVIYGLRQTVREARRLGPYTLVEKIGEGGMGAVYRASHALLRRPTAIKILPPQRAGEMDLARFEREVQMTSQLTSPHTVSVYDYGRTPDGLFYYAMEYLDGIDLEELVRRDGPMPPARVVHVLRQVCEALGEAHRAGLIHRDVKPANILLCERGGRFDVAKVVDFGLVKSVAGTDPGVTLENTAPGTPHYMAPEALSSPDRIDARSRRLLSRRDGVFPAHRAARIRRRAGGGPRRSFSRSPPPSPSARLGRSLSGQLDALDPRGAREEARRNGPKASRPSIAAAASPRRRGGVDGREAEAWWRGRGAEIKSARSGGKASKVAGSPRTLDIGREASVEKVSRTPRRSRPSGRRSRSIRVRTRRARPGRPGLRVG